MIEPIKFDPDYSSVTANVRRSEPLTRWQAVTVPAFATIDFAYHATALVLTALQAAVVNTLRLATPVKTHLGVHARHLSNAVIQGFTYPLVGVYSLDKLTSLHNYLCPQKDHWHHVRVAGAVAGTVLCLYTALSDTGGGASPTELSLNGIGVPLTLVGMAGSALATAYAAVQHRYGHAMAHKVTKRLAIAFGVTAVIASVYSLALESRATWQVAAACHRAGPNHWTCDVAKNQEAATHLSTELPVGQATNLEALRERYPHPRGMPNKQVRAKYHELVERSYEADVSPSLYPFVSSQQRKANRLASRDWMSFWDHFAVSLRDFGKYGHVTGPSVNMVMGPLAAAGKSADEMYKAVVGKSKTTNAFFDKLAQA